jgi:peptidoglycan/xylan/chitin deacetylase (PgdA/CDA1 family)
MIDRARLKEIYCRLLALAGGERRRLRRLRAADSLLILNLHRVSPRPDPFWSPLHPCVFEELLRFLRHEGAFVRLDDDADAHAGARPRVVLSFDDGYRDFVDYALPLIRRYGARANQNVIPECLLTGRPIWNVRLYDFLNVAPRAAIDAIALPGFATRLAGDTAQAKARYGLARGRFLKMRPRAERVQLMAELGARIEATGVPAPTRMMSVADVREAAAEGCEIGLHSFSHESMGFESDAFFAEDFERSAAYFRDALDLPLRIYAFPNGSCRPSQIAYLRQRGIEHVLLVGEGIDDGRSGVHPRLSIHGGSAAEVRMQAVGLHARRRAMPLYR